MMVEVILTPAKFFKIYYHLSESYLKVITSSIDLLCIYILLLHVSSHRILIKEVQKVEMSAKMNKFDYKLQIKNSY